MAKDPAYDLSIDLEDTEYEKIDVDGLFEDTKLDSVPIKELVNRYTDNDPAGNGIFDILMHSAEAHIHEEYNKNRITGSNYSQVYLGIMNTIIQTSAQMVMQADSIALEAEKLKAEIAQIKLQAKKLEAEIYRTRAEVSLHKIQIPLLKAQVATEQSKTQDVIMNGEKPEENRYGKVTSNIGGATGIQIASAVKAIDSQAKNDALALAKETVISPFNVIESSEGIGPAYYGLQGSNALEALNHVRKAYNISEINTDNAYSKNHQKYINTYCPDAVDQESTEE